MEIIIKQFEELELKELYDILKLRFDVFVLEQKSIYDEYDTIDFNSIHFFIKENDKIVAYARLYEKIENIAAIGRVVVHQNQRKKGVGKVLFKSVIEYTKQRESFDWIQIEAQEYLSEFYKSFGFEQTSDTYDDGGVLHIDMELKI